MRQLFIRDHNDVKVQGQRTGFNNEENPYKIPQDDLICFEFS